MYCPGLAERPETESGREQSHFGKPYELVGVGRSEVLPSFWLLKFSFRAAARVLWKHVRAVIYRPYRPLCSTQTIHTSHVPRLS
jgi:hypothetical protein